MELNRDDYCEECWLIVSNENEASGVSPVKTLSRKVDDGVKSTVNTPRSAEDNQIIKPNQAEKSISQNISGRSGNELVQRTPTVKSVVQKNEPNTDLDEKGSSRDSQRAETSITPPNDLLSDTRSTTKRGVTLNENNTKKTDKDEKTSSRTSQRAETSIIPPNSLSTEIRATTKRGLTLNEANEALKTGKDDKPSSTRSQKAETNIFPPNSLSTEIRATTKRGLTFNEDNKPPKTVPSTFSAKSNYSKPKTFLSTWSIPSILPSESQILLGARPSDSDLCLECLVLEHHHSFEKNILKNVNGSVEEPHECRIVSVQKWGQRKFMMVCGDSECPRFKFWKIVDSGGAGWKVVVSFTGCSPPPQEIGSTSCFMTSDGLCSKEQLVELSQVGLTPRIMDEVRPDIEISEWFCGRGDSTSTYGFKVSLLDGKQLMMYVYGECKTLEPPESAKWQKVTYTFRDYGPGVRYVLFHHGGSGEFTQTRGHREGDAYPGSRMVGASVRARLSHRTR